MAFSWYLPIRGLSVLCAIVELGLTGWLVHIFNNSFLTDGYYYVRDYSPSQVNFLLFSSIWTLLVLIYLGVATRWAHPESQGGGLWRHKFAVLAVDTLTCLFWFAGFIALAVLISGIAGCDTNFCNSLTASVVFGAFLWLLFLAAVILDIMYTMRGSNKAAGPTMRV